jgi:hypothetical protein
MFLTLGMKSFLTSVGTGSSTELFKMFLLYMNQSTQNVLIFSGIFSYSISYIAQRYVFCGGRFFGLSLLKFFSISLVTIQLGTILLNLLENIPIIKKYTEDKTITDTRKKIYQYLLINASILIIFFCIDLPLRKSFIFVKNKSIDYKYSYMLIGLAIVIYIINNNISSISITANSANSTVTTNPNVKNIISNNIHIDF